MSQKAASSTVPITVTEIEAIAKTRLPKNVYDYYSCGADEEKARDRNVYMLDRLLITPRVMVDVTHIDTSTTTFGKRHPFPVAFAPSAMQRLCHPRGELETAEAAASIGLSMTLSSQSTTSLEDVAKACNISKPDCPDFWFQLYLTQDPEYSLKLIKRAEKAGYTGLVLTVDTPVLGNRINERKTPLVLPEGMNLENYDRPKGERKPAKERIFLNAHTVEEANEIVKESGPTMHSSSLTWEHTIPWLRKATSMKIILKGIMTAEDAKLAVQHGADAIVVSNHGGRQLDLVPATIEVLPAIAEAVSGRIPVIFDGGVRRGSDVFKAIALGADLVLIGRPVLWGLSYDGKKGVEAVCNILERELSRTMALAGVRSIKEITKDSLGIAKWNGFGISKL
ncbi:FMN-dependent dehydrogenase [Aureobasidium pullulans]|uniref:FMN-dependent dehydrogenase n=1 Tax=Aureobasidium pullulans TaxID=5580 RepID=A0A4S9UPD3_AURPU|nr:FMN-dependent dehydrogenase [Aureobasidium pullulans]THZ39787.1 FMN-dependent dehydrogenase [Aureobasidium pullulans]THZ52859.1 FMN-dependent dehydrogenase [Aureobasidium pullulans]THZ93473.1 FMN-dependent dehydrogenase [Aureobasidium pullulans]